MRRQLLFTIVVAAGVPLALAACGGGSDPLSAVLAAAKASLAQRAEVDLSLRGSGLFAAGRGGDVVAKAAFAFPAGVGYEALQVPSVRGRAPGTAYLVFLPTRVEVEPVSSSGLPEGRLWISARLAAGAAARVPALAEALEGLDPELLLEEISWGAVAASSLGERVVAHVPFTEYRVTVDLRRALAAAKGPLAGVLGAAVREELGALGAARGASGSARVALRVWVDGPGRLAELEGALPGSSLGSITLSLSNFGATIPTSLPLDSTVVDLGSLPKASGAPTAARLFSGLS